MLYTVYSGSLSGPSERTTDDPALALSWGRSSGPSAFVSTPSTDGTRKAGDIVWTPESDRRCVGGLHAAIIDRALLEV
jgi:hypothetical protein